MEDDKTTLIVSTAMIRLGHQEVPLAEGETIDDWISAARAGHKTLYGCRVQVLDTLPRSVDL
jgi:hypothetical protein